MFHITSGPTGFFVNKSNRYTFDPLPASSACFSHELFGTLLSISASLKSAWYDICNNKSVGNSTNSNKGGNSGALNVIKAFYAQGRDDVVLSKPQWIVPLPNTFSTGVSSVGNNSGNSKSLKHTYNLSRMHDDLEDLFGAEEPGAPREW